MSVDESIDLLNPESVGESMYLSHAASVGESTNLSNAASNQPVNQSNRVRG